MISETLLSNLYSRVVPYVMISETLLSNLYSRVVDVDFNIVIGFATFGFLFSFYNGK